MTEQKIRDITDYLADLRSHQQSNRTGGVSSTNLFSEFKKESTDHSIPDCFQQQVNRYPDRVAVRTTNHELTYRALNRAANRIAWVILSQRDKRAEPIALLLEHDAPMVAAILGVLKAGKFYVALDPFYPLERNNYTLQDSQAELIVTNNKNLSLANSLVRNRCQLINIDEIDSSGSDEDPRLSVLPDSLAYILYTSGSTGQSKGVVHTHRTLLHNVLRHSNGWQISTDDRVALLFSYAFGASAGNIFTALLNGAALFPFNLKEEGLARVARWLIDEKITILHIVPTVFRHFIATLTAEEKFPKLRLVRLAGETIYSNDIELYKRNFEENCVLHLGMGTSETGTILRYFVDKQTDCQTALAPTGFATEDMEVLLLDEEGRTVGGDCVGEIAVKSRFLSPGYWRQPELTIAVFRPDIEGGSERIYLTGDLGYRLPDGCLVHLGRKDSQVKIRGHRIEVAEVEMALLEVVGIQEAAVVARGEVAGDNRLVAYLVTNRKPAPSVSELRGSLKERLPDYMMPSAFMLLEALPMLPNGKVDRRALPPPERTRPEMARDSLGARTPLEHELAGMWCQVLNLQQVGVDDNFFELGGHSLLATQVISRLLTTFRVELPLRRFFESPTVAHLALIVEESLLDKLEELTEDEARNLASQAPHLSPGLEMPIRDDTSQRKSKLSPAKRAVFEKWARGEFTSDSETRIIPRRQQDAIPLSFAQQRLWFLNQMEPDSSVYNLPCAIRLSGSLNVEAMQKTLDAIVARHEVMRTTFTTVDGNPVQVISEHRSVEMARFNLRDGADDSWEAEIHDVLQREAQLPFDLSRDLMLRVTLLRLKPDDHILLMVMHHIASDRWSKSILFQEFSVFYESFANGKEPTLPDLTTRYADYALWQRELLQGAKLEAELSYWMQQLGDAPPVLHLPTDRPRPAVQTLRGASESLALPKALSDALQTLSEQEGVTLFMTLLAAFQVLLHRYTWQDDIIVGSPIANRTRVETEGLIGFFVNTLVLRTDLSGQPTFRELLKRVQEVTLGAYENQDMPFEKLVEELQPVRSLSHTPLFQVMFTLQNAPQQALALSGLSMISMVVDGATSKFDLTLLIGEEAEGLRGRLEYNTDLFDSATITRLLSHFEMLLKGVVADPDKRLIELPMLTTAETDQLLGQWNETATVYPRDKCVHELFEAQVERDPDAIAMVFESTQLSYRELNRRANQVAHHLRALGVGPEVCVGILMERSVEMVVALLGILKAGGAYVPLDPAYPQERLSFMLADAEVPVLLTQAGLLDSVGSHGIEVVCLSLDWEQIARRSAENPDSRVTPDNLAYVIYTSGSTGSPKGVMNTHGGICNRLLWMQDAYQLTKADRVLQKTPFSFDVSVWEFFWPLLNGACLVVSRPGGHQDSVYLVKVIAEQQVTTLHFVPSMLRVFLEEPGLEACASLRQVMCSGEALSLELQKHFFARLTAELHNLYGPTEAAVDVTFWRCERESERRTVPIGRPIANTQIYILDSHLNPVPINVPGELHIGGAGLARGYLNRLELTTERFIANPFSREAGTRLYKTGDLARYLSDGVIEFIGRIDHQVKIRGFRIELEEIEAALAQHHAVQEALVIVREDETGEKSLVAYLVANQQPAPSSNELRSHLKTKLPEYMMPSTFVLLDAMPLTASGKTDRRALPMPDQTRPELEVTYIAPRTPVEEVMAGVWAKVLGLERVGVYDNFFELGGHSLLATQVVSRVRRDLQVELPMRTLFEEPTVAGLVSEIYRMWGGGPEIVEEIARTLEPLSEDEVKVLLTELKTETTTRRTTRNFLR